MLLTFEKQQTIKPISNNNQQRYGQIAAETENINLRDMLGAAFLYDIQQKATENPIPEKYNILLNGGTFIDCNDNTVYFRGLYFVLAYLNYRNYIGTSGYFDTFSGLVSKTRQEAELVSEGTIRRYQVESESIAMSEFELVKSFLNENTDTFTLWNCTIKRKPFNPRFSGIKKTIN